jgi:hypothetical protein
VRRVSSEANFWLKWYYIISWLVMMGLSFSMMLLPLVIMPLLDPDALPPMQPHNGAVLPWPFILISLALFAAFFAWGCVFTKLLFDLVDEVLDAGDALLIRIGHQQERIALSEIMKVQYSWNFPFPFIIMTLRRPSIFGTRIVFRAPQRQSFTGSKKAPIIDDLFERINAARRTIVIPRDGVR